ncbi:MAG: hypothetical protein AAFR51_03350 [Pseudomonadota bacterium]
MKRIQSAGILLALGGALSSQTADARPVSYPGGWTLMQQNNGDFSAAHAHYSPTFRDSFGLYIERNWETDWQFTGLQYNRLVKRWNAPNAQANFYVKAGAGQVDPFGDDLDTDLAGFIGVAADWETRRWFVSYEGRAYDLGYTQDARQSARIGVAPYIGDYGDVHTWLMLQVQNRPEAETPTVVTPLVRFFYDVQLLEIGYTPETEEVLLNWIVRF